MLQLKGTYIIAAIARDGVILASDSRGCIFNQDEGKKDYLAYYDNVQKIHVIGTNLMGVAGTLSFGEFFLCHQIELFRSINSHLATDEIIKSFLAFLKTLYGEVLYNAISRNQIFVVGYKDGKPMISYYDGLGVITNKNNEGAYVEMAHSSFKDRSCLGMSCDQMIIPAMVSINDYSIETNNVHLIGGPISVAKVGINGIGWLVNEPTPHVRTMEEFAKLYLKGEVEMRYLYNGEHQMDEMFKRRYPHLYT